MTIPRLSLRISPAWIAGALAIAAGLLLGLPAPAHAAGEDDVTWTVRTESNDLGAERTSFTYTINPGATVTDGLVITNRGDAPVDLGVYAADGYTTDGGQFDLLVGGEKSAHAGAWVKMASEHVTVPQGGTVTVPFTVSIPADATPGDYAGGVVTSMADAQATGVNVDRRLGIRMNLRVGGTLKPGLAVENVHVAWSGGLNPLAGGDATVTYTLHNTGNVIVTAAQAAHVAGPFGWFQKDAAKMDAPPQLLPGETWTQTVSIPDVAPLVVLTGTASIIPLVTDASGSTSPMASVEGSASGWAVPWTLLVIVLLVAAAVIVWPRVARRRKAVQQAREDARVQEAVAQALQEVQPETTSS